MPSYQSYSIAQIINDGFCDCSDGSDEVGTAACSYIHQKSSFTCPNNNSAVKVVIPLSRVQDGNHLHLNIVILISLYAGQLLKIHSIKFGDKSFQFAEKNCRPSTDASVYYLILSYAVIYDPIPSYLVRM